MVTKQYVRVCSCGCGQPTTLATKTVTSRGQMAGQPCSMLSGHGAHRPIRYVADENGCWIWQGKPTPGGYGRTWDGTRNRPAHRYMYEQKHGPVRAELVMDHLCRVRLCVNPDHLEPVTPRENIARGESTPAQVWRTGKCVRGHEYDEKNTRIAPNGQMVCRKCALIWQTAKRARKKLLATL